jgi:CubicO group peptidase (beta-lactamase class C family)
MCRSPRSVMLALLLAAVVPTAAVAAAATEQPVGPRTDEPAAVAAIDAHVEEGLRANRVPGGALAIVDQDGQVHLRGYGVTGRGGGAVTPDTPFIIGSVTKSMTALAVLQLVEDGRVDLDAPVSRYLAWFEVVPASSSDRITVRHLLEHTSGLPALAGAPATTWLRDLPIEETARAVVGSELARDPGVAWEYTNANYVLLGALIEEVAGQPYAEVLEERLFAPLGMTRTTAELATARALGLSDGHRYVFGVPVAHTSFREGLVPSGLVTSTARDLGRYLLALSRGGELDGERVLSAAGVDALFTPASDATLGPWAKDRDAAYAMGWFVGGGPFGPTPAVFHPGATPDFGALAAVVPSTSTALALLVNVGPRVAVPGAAGDVDRIGAGAVSLLTDSEPVVSGTVADAYRVATPVLVVVLLLALGAAIRRPPARRRVVGDAVVAILCATAATALLGLPTIVLGWRQSALWAPDLTAVAAVAGTAFAVAAARRVLHLRRTHRSAPPTTDPPVPLTAGQGRSDRMVPS